MKRVLTIMFFSIAITSIIYAQKVELVASYPFGNIPFEYYTKWDPNEGGMPSFTISMIIENNQFLVFGSSKDLYHGGWYALNIDGTADELNIIPDYSVWNTQPQYGTFSGGYFIGYSKNNNYYLHITYNDMKYIIEVSQNEVVGNNLYLTGNTLFFEDSMNHKLSSIEFFSDGSYRIRNASETESWLKSGKGEELGWSQKFNKRNGKVSSNYFGDVNLSTVTEFYKPSCFDNAHDDEIIGAAFDALWNSRYNNFAKDSKGLIYFRKMDTDNGPYKPGAPANNIKFDIAILDPWTKQVKYYEDYAPNEFNPPRDADGKIIGSYSWTVAPDGNIYFTDADVEKGEYQIKRVINRGWDEMGINDRIIGQMNTNHIPLLTTMNGSQNDGYCFENDFVWVTEQSKDKKWSKIKKIDGREGWIETKYIDINTMIPVTNASLGITIDQASASTLAPTTPAAAKILKAADNLRLRKTELTSSEVITTMQKGTPVKIVATGRKETIDGITGNWVQVEVQSGGKDRNGSPIPAGTTGWCFGGYLE